MVYTIDMISKEKDRVIVSIPKSSIKKLDKICEWYKSDFRSTPATRSEVIDDLINLFSNQIGVK